MSSNIYHLAIDFAILERNQTFFKLFFKKKWFANYHICLTDSKHKAHKQKIFTLFDLFYHLTLYRKPVNFAILFNYTT